MNNMVKYCCCTLISYYYMVVITALRAERSHHDLIPVFNDETYHIIILYTIM